MRCLFAQRRRVLLVLCLAWGIGASNLAAATPARRTPVVLAVEKASPAVVNISTEKIVQVRSSLGFSDPFFEQYFRDFLDPLPRRQYTQSSLGSGVIIDAEGHVLTNQHVILKASKITITLADNREFEGELIGADADVDVAVVKITNKDALPVAPLGASHDLLIGEPVIAIGNPFGLSHTITTGVISAVNRAIRVNEDRVFRGLIQTDAPINPGNSGGPLINILGEVIGINTAIYQEAQGIGFAIPIDKARRLAQELIAHGEVRRPWVGINIQDITPGMAHYFNYSAAEGVLISQVLSGSAAEQAGLQQGDIIVAINQQPVHNVAGYYTLLAELTPDATLRLTLVRQGKALDIQLPVEEFSVERAVKLAYQGFGMIVEEITQQTTAAYRLRTDQGVVTTQIRPQSSAAQVGLEPGDIIRQIDRMPVTNLKDFRNAMVTVSQQTSAVFLVQRGGRGYYITLENQ